MTLANRTIQLSKPTAVPPDLIGAQISQDTLPNLATGGHLPVELGHIFSAYLGLKCSGTIMRSRGSPPGLGGGYESQSTDDIGGGFDPYRV